MFPEELSEAGCRKTSQEAAYLELPSVRNLLLPQRQRIYRPSARHYSPNLTVDHPEVNARRSHSLDYLLSTKKTPAVPEIATSEHQRRCNSPKRDIEQRLTCNSRATDL
jgi:hypothetical protein